MCFTWGRRLKMSESDSGGWVCFRWMMCDLGGVTQMQLADIALDDLKVLQADTP